jgi:hypothetical protein
MQRGPVTRYVPLIVILLSVACGMEPTSPTTLMPPPAARPPVGTPLPPQPSRFVSLWGIVVDPSGACIEGATVEVLAGANLVGQKTTQVTPCDLTRFGGGFIFDEVVDCCMPMTLGASAPGYISQVHTFEPYSLDRIHTFTLVPQPYND